MDTNTNAGNHRGKSLLISPWSSKVQGQAFCQREKTANYVALFPALALAWRLWAYRGLNIRGWWVFHPDPVGFAGGFTLPTHTHIQGMQQPAGPRRRTVAYAAAADPALIRIEHNGRLALFRVGRQHGSRAGIHAGIAACTEFRIEDHYLVRRHRVRYHISFVIHVFTVDLLSQESSYADLKTAMFFVVLCIRGKIRRFKPPA
jgi:hypothetical protein